MFLIVDAVDVAMKDDLVGQLSKRLDDESVLQDETWTDQGQLLLPKHREYGVVWISCPTESSSESNTPRPDVLCPYPYLIKVDGSCHGCVNRDSCRSCDAGNLDAQTIGGAAQRSSCDRGH